MVNKILVIGENRASGRPWIVKSSKTLVELLKQNNGRDEIVFRENPEQTEIGDYFRTSCAVASLYSGNVLELKQLENVYPHLPFVYSIASQPGEKKERSSFFCDNEGHYFLCNATDPIMLKRAIETAIKEKKKNPLYS